MKTLKNLVRATLAAILLSPATQHLHAQGFCEWIGDGLNGLQYQQINELVPIDNDIAFLGWNGDPSINMETFVGRVNTSGTRIWSRSLDLLAPNEEFATALLKTANGDLILASNSATSFSLARINGANGAHVSAITYPGDFKIVGMFEQANGRIQMLASKLANDEVTGIIVDANLDFVSARRTGIICNLQKVIKSGTDYYGVGHKTDANGTFGVVFKLRSSLTHAWTNVISTGNGSHFLTSIGQFNGGSLIVGGHDGNCEDSTSRLVTHGFTSAGSYITSRGFTKGSECFECKDLAMLPGGDVIFTGSRLGGQGTVFTFTLNNSAQLLGATLNGPGAGLCLGLSSASQVILGGKSINPNGQLEGYLSGLGALGESCCSDPFTIDSVGVNVVLTSPMPIGTILFLSGSHFTPGIDFGDVTVYCPVVAPKVGVVAESPVAPLFPNPANTEIQVTIEDESGAVVQIYDLKGQLMTESHLPIGRSKIAVDDLESGLYLVRVNGANGLRTHRLAIAR